MWWPGSLGQSYMCKFVQIWTNMFKTWYKKTTTKELLQILLMPSIGAMKDIILTSSLYYSLPVLFLHPPWIVKGEKESIFAKKRERIINSASTFSYISIGTYSLIHVLSVFQYLVISFLSWNIQSCVIFVCVLLFNKFWFSSFYCVIQPISLFFSCMFQSEILLFIPTT